MSGSMSTCASAGADARPSFGRDRRKRVEMRFAHLTIRHGQSSRSAAFWAPFTTSVSRGRHHPLIAALRSQRLRSCRLWSLGSKPTITPKSKRRRQFSPCSQPLEPSSSQFAAVCDLTIVSKILNYHMSNYLIIVYAGDRHDVEGVRAAQELPAEDRPADRE